MGRRRGPPLLSEKDYSSGRRVRKVRVSEVVGGTTAECTAVACCIPCVVVELVVQAVYKVPAGLCRNALRLKRRRRAAAAKNGLFQAAQPRRCCDDSVLRMHPHLSATVTVAAAAVEPDEDAVELEKEMWNKFYGGGFWRSPSQRSEVTQL